MQSSTNNQWVESYLDALLSDGLSSEYVKKPQARDEEFNAERQLFSKYYIAQIMQLEEEGIHEAWSKATSTRNYGEKDARLEYLSWRVWFMKRKRDRVRKEELGRVSQLQLDDEPVHVELDEDERVETASLASDLDNKAFTKVKYVVELARALAQHPAVYRVDLLTRLIKDPKVDATYGEPEECILHSEGQLGGAYIVRLPCGPEDVYLRKEHLWPHLREFADRGIAHCKKMQVQLMEANTPCELYAVHGHYADAGECAAMISATLGVDMVMTGHSLGRNKLEHLQASGTISRVEIEKTYKISRRIEAEERGLDSAMMVFTSTQQEIDEQWGLYEGYDPKLADVLRSRRRLGRYMPYMKVIAPGLDFSSLKVELPEDPARKEMEQMKPAFNARTTSRSPNSTQGSNAFKESRRDSGPQANGKPPIRAESSFGAGDNANDPAIWKSVFRFLQNPRKPVILAMSRPDAKKNITTLIKAFGEDETLRKLANLVLIMGNREDIEGMAPGSQKILNQVLKMIDAYDLYGSVAYPKRHQQSDISDIYRLSLPPRTRGVFTNVALQEPFGLTVIEAAAHGVPTVATMNGGPVDIMRTLHSGILVDPTDSKQIAAGCLKILTNTEVWDQLHRNGIDNIMAYSWPSHCKRYLESMEAEKKFLKKSDRSRLSGSWDHRTQLPSPSSQQREASIPIAASRLRSTPYPEKLPSAFRLSAARKDPPPSTDNAALPSQPSGTPQGWARERRHFIAVQIDGAHRLSSLGPLLDSLVKEVQKDPSLGIGLVSMLGFEDTAKALKEGGFGPEPFDWMVCNSGADIWHALKRGSADGDVWDADDAWEEHINHRWERAPLAQMVTKLLSRDKPQQLPARSGTMGRTLLKALGDLPEYHEGNSKLHPHHIRIELDDMAKQSIDMGKKLRGPQKEELSTVIVDRIRRRLRQNGFRCHITLQMVPEEGELVSHMHITPMWGTRALALRFLATKFGLSMANFTVLAVPANVTDKGDNKVIAAHTSDMIELISGVSKVFVNIPASDEAIPPTKGAADRAVLERLAIKVNPKLFGTRIQFLDDRSQIQKVVAEASEQASTAERLTLKQSPRRSSDSS